MNKQYLKKFLTTTSMLTLILAPSIVQSVDVEVDGADGDNSAKKIGAANNLVFKTDNEYTISKADTAAEVKTETDGEGVLVIQADFTSGDIGIDSGRALNEISINNTLTATGDIKATNGIIFNDENGKLVLQKAGGAVDATITANTNNFGTITVENNTTFNNDIGADGKNIAELTIDAGAEATFVGDKIYAVGVSLEGANSKLILDNDGAAIHAPIIAAVDGKGIVQVSDNATFNGDIGADGKNIAELQIDAGQEATFEGGFIYANSIRVEDGGTGSTLVLNKDGAEVHAPIRTGTANKGIVQVSGNASFMDKIGYKSDGTAREIAELKIDNGKKAKLYNDLDTAEVTFSGATSRLAVSTQNNAVTIADTTITVQGDGQGFLEIASDSVEANAVTVNARFGTNKTTRFGTLILAGPNETTFSHGDGSFIKNIYIGGTGKTTFDNNLDQGDNALIEINNKNADATIEGNVTQGDSSKITFTKEGKATFTGEVVQGDNSNLTFTQAGTATFDDKFTQGAGSKIVFNSAGTAKFSGAATALREIDFAADGTLILNNANITFNNDITSSAGDVGNVEVLQDLTIDQKIGVVAGNKIKELKISGKTLTFEGGELHAATTLLNGADSELKLDAAATVKGNVATANDNEGVVIVNENTTFEGNIGTSTKMLKKLQVADGKTATVKGKAKAKEIELLGGNGATLKLTENLNNFTSHVKTATANKSSLEFGAGVNTIDVEIGTAADYLADVKFTGTGNKVQLNKQIHAQSIIFGDNEFETVNDLAIGRATGTLALSDTTLHIKENEVKILSDMTFNDETVLHFTRTSDTQQGLIDNSGAAAADMTGVTLFMENQDHYVNTGETLSIIKYTNTPTNIDKFKKLDFGVNDELVKWKLQAKGGVLFAEAERVKEVSDLIGKNLSPKGSRVLKVFESAHGVNAIPVGTSASKLYAKVESLKSPERMAETIERFLPDDDSTIAANNESSESLDMATGLVQSRATQIGGGSSRRYSSLEGGVSAGESHSKSGFWFKGMAGSGKQRKDQSRDGFSSTIYGGVFGYDSELNDRFAMGAALSLSETKLKHKDNIAGNKTKINSGLLSVYGQYDLPKNFFATGMMYGGMNLYNASVKKGNAETGYEFAKEDYNSSTYGLGFGLGHAYQAANEIILINTANIRYHRVQNIGYEQTGTENQNLTIYKKSQNSAIASLGTNVSKVFSNSAGLTFTPNIHAMVNYELINKSPSSVSRLDGLPDPIVNTGSKPRRLSGDVGVGVDVGYKNVKLELDYNAHVKKKFIRHMGSIKITVGL